jgi:hypothetical protein
MSTLHVCEGCARHVRDDKCPFCDQVSSPPRPVTTAVAVALTVAVGLTLSACYGGPPRRDNLEGGGGRGATPTAAEDAAPAASQNK